ncbi:MAG: hypothetical protein [Bacteriophage sp.]|nr:MAG: hypothetical protein [Bacteriophage sp.]
MSIELTTVNSGYNLSAINNNFQALQQVLNSNILWRTGSVAGESLMNRDLDMNGNAILNIGVDLNNPESLLTLNVADARYYNISGDVLEGDMDAGQHRIKNLQAPSSQYDAVRKLELDQETAYRQGADASLQEQMTGNVPLEASAFSQISWHDQVIPNSVTIPDNKNAWSFGPQMEIEQGQLVTVGAGSSWTIANGRVVEDEDLHNLIADTITTSNGASVIQVSDVASNTSLTALTLRVTAEETKIQPLALGGTGGSTAPVARSNLGLGSIATQASSSVSISGGTISGITDLAVADGGTGASTAAAARSNLGAAASGVNSDITQLTGLNSPSPLQGVVDASNAATGKVGEVLTAITALSAITTNVDTNLVSISLTPGDWDVSGVARFETSASAITSVFCGLTTTSATAPGFPAACQISGMTSGGTQQVNPPLVRFNVSATTTVYLVGRAAFASGTATARGYIQARRIR